MVMYYRYGLGCGVTQLLVHRLACEAGPNSILDAAEPEMMGKQDGRTKATAEGCRNVRIYSTGMNIN
jgi:hypothetical protein